jgi:Domain of unknown function (DUF4881)
MLKKDNRLMSALAVFLLVAVLAGCQKMGRVDQGRVIEFNKEKGTVTMIRDASPNPDTPEYSHLPPVTYQVPTNPDEMGADPKPGKRMKLDANNREIVIYVPALNNFAKINYTLVDQKENVGPDDPLVLDKVTRKPKTFPVVDPHRKTITIYSKRQKTVTTFSVPDEYFAMPVDTWDSGDDIRIYYKEEGKARRLMNVSKTDIFKK